MSILRNLLYLTSILFISGCVTYRESSNDAGLDLFGGFKDYKVYDGIYFIKVESGTSAWSNFDSLTSVWDKRAEALCNGKFKKLYINLDDFEQFKSDNLVIGNVSYSKSFSSGYAVCDAVNLKEEQARDIILKPKISAASLKILEDLLSIHYNDCVRPNSVTNIEPLEEIAWSFYQKKNYNVSAACFFHIYKQTLDTKESLYSYELIGDMFKHGLGVSQNTEYATEWYIYAGVYPNSL